MNFFHLWVVVHNIGASLIFSKGLCHFKGMCENDLREKKCLHSQFSDSESLSLPLTLSLFAFHPFMNTFIYFCEECENDWASVPRCSFKVHHQSASRPYVITTDINRCHRRVSEHTNTVRFKEPYLDKQNRGRGRRIESACVCSRARIRDTC